MEYIFSPINVAIFVTASAVTLMKTFSIGSNSEADATSIVSHDDNKVQGLVVIVCNSMQSISSRYC